MLGTVALACGAALVVGLLHREEDGRVQLAVHLSASLCLAIGAYTVLLECGNVDLAIGFVLSCLLAPLALCAAAATIAGAVVLHRPHEHGWRYVLVAVAAASIPFLRAVAGDPGDAPEAAIRRQLGNDALVTCSPWELEKRALLCAIDDRVGDGGTAWSGSARTVRSSTRRRSGASDDDRDDGPSLER